MDRSFLSNVIISDYIIHENLCNFRCKYCLGKDLKEDSRNLINSYEENNKRVKYESNCDIERTINTYEKYINAEIFQLSGGELFMIENISDFIEDKSKRYEKVVILTNGFLLNETVIKQLAKYKNIVFGISLDGHTLEMNSYRFQSENTLKRIVENIKLLIKYDSAILINMVLHNKNIDYIKEFLYYLSNLSNKIAVFPAILRGTASDVYNYSEEKAEILLDIAEDNELVARLSIVPEYFREMYNVCKSGFKSFNCYTSMFSTEMFHNGELVCCPLNWIKIIGNIVEDSPDEVFNKFGNDEIYHLLRKKSKGFKACKYCLSHYDVINMYLEDIIDLNTIKKVSFLNTPKIIEKIEFLKKVVKDAK